MVAAPARAVVVIVNWNGGAYLRQCLKALQVQTEPRFAAVVVDNGSTDVQKLKWRCSMTRAFRF